ncbi:Alpha/Beta hydrolase protein [Lasiosphaeria hispida]|uniref:Alpha/Beta hydrolase protein n=1 Tax=Lasiosphaeria hispida TaxID=260671 RepID=A0AAJ0MEU7_9PEZI|nr:Alpha/Beta hydrolase protein [Lasiosphaeria hispida]
MSNTASQNVDPAVVGVRAENAGILTLQAVVQDIRLKFPTASKQTPIVLVPGFSGWGRPLLGAVNYFGGFSDLALTLAAEGYPVIQVRLSPISSNKERACEIFEQLTNINGATGFDTPGTTPPTLIPVNYGALQITAVTPPPPPAQTWQAVVYGNLPAGWAWSAQNRVIFICHSQGGNSVRQLLHYMSGRAPQDLAQFGAVDKQAWVKAVITLGTPHRGTTITQAVQGILQANPNLEDAAVDFVTSCSFANRQDRVFDLGLDHWGFTRLGQQDTFDTMRQRIRPHVIAWLNGTDNGIHDNSIAGAGTLNSNTAAYDSPPTYFLTMSFCATTPFPNRTLTTQDVREFLQLLPLGGVANFIGLPWLISSFLSWGNWRGATPPLRSVLAWMTDVANRHLGALGYFSRIPRPGPQVPRHDMLPIIAPFAYAIGGINVPGEDREPNDGVVNTMSMDGPQGRVRAAAPGSFAAELNQVNPQTTAWGPFWHFGSNAAIDHADQLGIFTDASVNAEVGAMYELFAELADRIP